MRLFFSCRPRGLVSNGMSRQTLFRVQRRFQGHGRPSYSDVAAALKTLDARLDMDPKTLKKCYMELVKKHHPDKGGCPEKMKTITHAYDVLKGLSISERANFSNQFGGAPRKASGGGGARPSQQPGAGSTNYNRGAGSAAYDWQKMYDEQAKSRDFSYQYSKGHHGNPFGMGGNNAFRSAMGQTRWQLLRTPLSTIIWRITVAYFIITLFFMAFYRRYRDYLHDDGWRASESLSRKEQMEDMYRMRTEIIDKLGNSPYMQRMIAERDKERQLMEYAARRSKENAELQRSGYESFNPLKGQLHRKAEDPDGVVYFEPRPAGMGGSPPGPRLSEPPSVTNYPTNSRGYVEQARQGRAMNAAAVGPFAAEGSPLPSANPGPDGRMPQY